MDRIQAVIWRTHRRDVLLLTALGAGLVWLMHQSGLLLKWSVSEEYGHGPLVLLLLGYLIYCRRRSLPFNAAGNMLLIGLAATLPMGVYLLGAVAGIATVEMYSVWGFGLLLVFALGGMALLRALWVPLLIAFMTIPLPFGAEAALIAQMQWLSAELGVWFIRLFGGVAHLESNVIDMGTIRLLIVEACAGLRYLFPLMTLGALAGYLLQAPLWMRWLLFLSTLPIALFVNGLRIGVTGVLAHHLGRSPGEGFLHFFEGWVVFLFAVALVLGLLWMLLRLLPSRPRLFDAIAFDAPEAGRSSVSSVDTVQPAARHGEDAPEPLDARRSAALSIVLVALLFPAILAPLQNSREEAHPDRQLLTAFPNWIEQWSAGEYRQVPLVEAVAGASESYYADFSTADRGSVELHVAYFATQRERKIPYSARIALPGDGWNIKRQGTVAIPHQADGVFSASRLVAARGDRTVVAYYWLKQGPRTHHQFLPARLDLIRSALFANRTDGALIRLIAELHGDDTVEQVENRLLDFARAVSGVLPQYLPD